MNRSPQRIQDGFPGILGKIDAVFHYNGKEDLLEDLRRDFVPISLFFKET